MKKFNPIQTIEDDGLEIMEVGNWAQLKYKLVGKYCDIFTSGMKNKWDLVYLDLFSGPGFVKIKETKSCIKNSALIAMSLPNSFNHYVLNDFSKSAVSSLEERVERLYSDKSFKIYNQDANLVVDRIFDDLPTYLKIGKPLFFAFIDPFSLNLHFDTIKKLSAQQVDILVLHALQMDGIRNMGHYIKENNPRLNLFFGNSDWRYRLTEEKVAKGQFVKFLSDEFDNSIRKLGYKTAIIKERITNNQGSGIYYLSFYSKHERGLEFFEKVRKGNNNQYEIF
ncbi:three-Cys-motif partner protein TcmP [Belliella kenyensis]|uniref:Three-Cys-motif partner protein TcmP n=1 Tax=Belliella kenyensis TaxID=1472724 RepID=A0ABV8EL74_9BACT|nr:three-Cys-motif partner protein TcmP [Belliella kenyensis]MCH7402970.1 three-Cys-motif partner protein TcmP [Belliella kenyensis]MDN3605006.1 three-Cys-motif partner protein TcmP [Belliella kenyensis]